MILLKEGSEIMEEDVEGFTSPINVSSKIVAQEESPFSFATSRRLAFLGWFIFVKEADVVTGAAMLEIVE